MFCVFCRWVLLIRLEWPYWHLLGKARLVLLAVLNFFSLILILCLYIYIYILVIGNIMNKYLFMQIKIAKNLSLFGETTIILFI